LVTTLLK